MIDGWFKRTPDPDEDLRESLERRVNELIFSGREREQKLAHLVETNDQLTTANESIQTALAESEKSVSLLRDSVLRFQQHAQAAKAEVQDGNSRFEELRLQLKLSGKKRLREKQRILHLTAKNKAIAEAYDSRLRRVEALENEVTQLAGEIVSLNSRVEHSEAECRRSDASFLRSSSLLNAAGASSDGIKSEPQVSLGPFEQRPLAPTISRILVDTISVASRALDAVLAGRSHLAATMGFEESIALLPTAPDELYTVQEASPKIHDHLHQLGVLDTLLASYRGDGLQVSFRLGPAFRATDRAAVSQWVGAQIVSGYSRLCDRSFELCEVSGGPTEFHCIVSLGQCGLDKVTEA